MNVIIKYAITAFIVVLVSEIAKRADRIGALIASLPIVTILTMIWLHLENQHTDKIANHAYYTFWYVLPTLPMFLLIPWLLKNGIRFEISIGLSAVFTAFVFLVTSLMLKRIGVDLLP
ncbi:DUF3147 family protein [Cerasicoccus maritimus]|uniref:DUF3147 family protein n=1 Tax=Cerasicoccus maritimus TaxID=490089 RepID=UPI003CCCF00D